MFLPGQPPIPFAALLLLLTPLLPRAAAGQKAVEDYERPRAIATFTREPIVIDGRLDEGAWRKAGRIENFRQVEPRENSPPSERTRVLLCHDRDHLYIGLLCFDRDPEGIRATQLERDARLDPDDRVEIVLDTFRSHRNAYFIQIGPGGSLGDGLIGENGRRFSKAWDGIFRGRARITERGWQAEIAVPAATIRFDPEQSTWGINFNRHIRRKDEVVRWAHPYRHRSFFKPSDTGDLVGMVGLDESWGVAVKPYLAAGRSSSREEGHSRQSDAGGDLFISLTPSLTAVLTFNTDFAEAEVDSRRVNLTRFPLFFPEKRDFFLEAAPSFEFGLGRRDLLPFYSRRVGRDDEGNPLPLHGGKLVGRAGDYGIGVMAMHTEASGGVPAKSLGVARFTRSILEESLVGVIATAGNPTEEEDNALAGIDFDLRTSEYMGDKNLSLRGYALGSESEGARGRDLAFGAALDYGNEPLGWHARFEEVQENFRPELGFVRRTGIRRWFAKARWTGRTEGWLRRFRAAVTGNMVTGCRENGFRDGQLSLTPCNITFHTGDRLRLSVHGRREDLEESFEISEGVVVPPGRYETLLPLVRLNTSDKRPLSLGLGFDRGTFYSGWITRWNLRCSVRVSNRFQAALDYDQRDVDLAEGDFTTRLASLKTVLTPAPGLSWTSRLQYDNVSDTVGLNSRLRWIVAEGNDIFLILNQGWEAGGGRFRRESRNVKVKVAWTFQF